MKMRCYSFFDVASAAYMRPFFLHSDGQALRVFKDLAVSAEHEIGKHPEDYSLVFCGIWDDHNAQFQPEPVKVLATALEVIASSQVVQSPGAEMEKQIFERGTNGVEKGDSDNA